MIWNCFPKSGHILAVSHTHGIVEFNVCYACTTYHLLSKQGGGNLQNFYVAKFSMVKHLLMWKLRKLDTKIKEWTKRHKKQKWFA